MKNISPNLQHLAQEPAKIVNMSNNRQILPGNGAGMSGLASNGSDGFNKCLTYQLAMAADVNRANQESNINRETSNPVRGNGTDSSDLISNSSVGFNKCLTYQLAMAADFDRQAFFQRQILSEKTDGLLES